MKRFILFIFVFISFLSCSTRVETENTNQSNSDFIRPGDTLVVYAAFTVAPNGKIERVWIEKVEYSGSGNKKPDKKDLAQLKKEVIRTIKKMGPFKATGKRIRYHLPIGFVVKDD